METEIVDEIPEYSTASLHVNETENVLNRKDELLKENYSEKETKLTSIQVVDAPGQVVPSHSCLKSETEASKNNEHSTVLQVSLEAIDLEETEHFSKQSEINQDKLSEGREFEQFTSPLEQEDPVKTFHWPPIGFKDQITERAATSKPDTFDQVVSYTNEENNDNGLPIAKQVPQTNTISYASSNENNQSETKSSHKEHHNLTSILKKDDNQAKKTVHFPENIVSVKFYEISDEEDSDNDTVILSDPEEDDLRDQEVPFNTYDDYNTNFYHPSSISMNFIPQFTFSPVLKITNCQLYDTIDDDDEQTMAIMKDNDGREQLHANDLETDEIYPQEGISGSQDDHLTSKEVITLSTNPDNVFREGNTTEYRDDRITSVEVRKLSENPEEALEIIEIQTPLTKNGIEGNEDNIEVKAYKNMNGTFEAEGLVVNQRTSTDVKTRTETSEEELEVHTPMTQNGIERQSTNEHHDDQLTFMKVTETISENPEEMKAPVGRLVSYEIGRLVSYDEENTSELQDDQRTCKEVKTLSETPVEANEIIEVQTPTTKNEIEPLEEDLEIKAHKYLEETLENASESSVEKESTSVVENVNQSIENPAVIVNSTTCASNETETNAPITKVNAPEQDSKVYTLLDVLKSAPKNSISITDGANCNTMEGGSTEENFVQQATSPERFLGGTMASMNMLPKGKILQFNAQRLDKMKEKLTGHDMVEKWLKASQKSEIVPYDETFTMEESFGNRIAPECQIPYIDQPTVCNYHSNPNSNNSAPLMTENVGLPATDMTGLSAENMIRKLELTVEDKSEPAQVDVSAESKESSDGCMEVTPSSSSARTFHGNCGSNFLWRGPRSIHSMVLDEDFQVPAVPTADNEILHERSLTKEEIIFPKFAITDAGSLELNILAAVWNENAATKHCHEEFQLEKYAHSFLSSPDHVNEFEETWESAIETDFPNKKQRMENYAHKTWLKHGHLNSGIGESIEQYETEFHEHQRTKLHSATTFEYDNQGDTAKYSDESLSRSVNPHQGHAHYLTAQIVPDMYNVQDQLKAQPMKDSSRAVPFGADDVIMDTTNTSLQYPRQSRKTFGQREGVKEESCITPVSYDQGLPSKTSILARQGRRKLRVGLSKSTRVKPLHPYWSKKRIKESGSIS